MYLHTTSYLKSGVDSNFTIKCQDRTWKVNKGLLGQRCDYFRAVAHSGFSVRYAVASVFGEANQMEQEHSNELLAMDSEDPDIIIVLLESIYTVTDRTRPCHGNLASLENHKELSADLKHLISVVVVAEMYLVPALMEAADEKISARLSRIVLRLQCDDSYMTEELFSGLLEALYSSRDCPAVETHRATFIDAIVRAERDIAKTLITERHMKKYPQLGWTVMSSMERKMQLKLHEKESTITTLIGQLPKKRKREWKDCLPEKQDYDFDGVDLMAQGRAERFGRFNPHRRTV